MFEILQSILILTNCPMLLLRGYETNVALFLKSTALQCVVPDRWDGGMMLATMKACATRAACKGAANDQTDQTAIKINLLQGGSDQ